MGIPSGTLYSDLMAGYFGYLDNNEQNQLWQIFKKKNGLVTDPTDDSDTALVQKFSAFIESTYSTVQLLNLSPEEVHRRTLLFSVLDLIIAMLRTIQDNVAVTGGELAFLAKYQKVYTDQMKRAGESFYITPPSSTNTPVVNINDLSEWTLGYAGITMEEYLTSALVKGATPPPAIPPSPPSLPIRVGSGTITQGFSISTIKLPLPDEDAPIATITIPISSRAADAITFDVKQEGLDPTTLTMSFSILLPNAQDPITVTKTSVINISIVDTKAITAFITSELNDFYNTPVGTTGKTVGELINDPTYQFSILPPTFENDATYSSGFVFLGIYNFFEFDATENSFTTKFTAHTFTGLPEAQDVSVEKTITFSPDATLEQKLAAAKAAFVDLYDEQVGFTGRTVQQFVNDPQLPIRNLYAVVSDGDATFSMITGLDGSDEANAAVNARASKNELIQQFIENARSRREIIANVADGSRSQLGASQQAISAATGILLSTIKQLRAILDSIFRIV